MVAYSFKRNFGPAIKRGLMPGTILAGMKRQTIRADRRRHARPGEVVQLYHGMRTKQCELIGRVRCVDVKMIEIHFAKRHRRDWIRLGGTKIDRPGSLHSFAQHDGFQCWPDLRSFWKENHPQVDVFKGVIIFWEPLAEAADG